MISLFLKANFASLIFGAWRSPVARTLGVGKAASSNLVAPTFFFPFLFALLFFSCRNQQQPPILIYTEDELQIPFEDLFSHYNQIYHPNAVIKKGGTSRKLIAELFRKKNIIISRPLIEEELELFKKSAISIDTLGFGEVSYTDSAGDINSGYNLLLVREKKIKYSQALKLFPSYLLDQKNQKPNKFRFPILLVSVSEEREIRKLKSYFDYELPNTILKKYNIIPFKQSTRTIFIE